MKYIEVNTCCECPYLQGKTFINTKCTHINGPDSLYPNIAVQVHPDCPLSEYEGKQLPAKKEDTENARLITVEKSGREVPLENEMEVLQRLLEKYGKLSLLESMKYIEDLENSINGALKIKDLWLPAHPKYSEEHDEEFKALSTMESKLRHSIKQL